MKISARGHQQADACAMSVEDTAATSSVDSKAPTRQTQELATASTSLEYFHRIFDLAIAVPVVILTAPILAVAWLLIRLESPGPAIYRQTRVGKNGDPFTIYKLRTMVNGAERIGSKWATHEGDDRITSTGRRLRRYSLDELPNLWNVIRGEMSIVGPRPTLGFQVEQYTERQRRRLDVKPGITGWAQVNGRASLPWHERIELDLWYVKHRSLRLDSKILLRTAALILRGQGIYRGERGGWYPPSQQDSEAARAEVGDPGER